MQFTKVVSIIALAATSSAYALPEPVDAGPVNANGNYTLFSDATTKVITGLNAYSDANVATVNSLVASVIGSAKSDAALTASAIATIVGGGKAYADALATILTQLSACAAASA